MALKRDKPPAKRPKTRKVQVVFYVFHAVKIRMKAMYSVSLYNYNYNYNANPTIAQSGPQPFQHIFMKF